MKEKKKKESKKKERKKMERQKPVSQRGRTSKHCLEFKGQSGERMETISEKNGHWTNGSNAIRDGFQTEWEKDAKRTKKRGISALLSHKV